MVARLLYLKLFLLLCFNVFFSHIAQADVAYTYDANGNIESSLDTVGNSAYYTYNAKNELTKVERTLSSGEEISVTYTYDINGNRDSKTVNGVTTEFLIDSNRPLPVVISETVNGQVAVTYEYGPDGYSPISQTRAGVKYDYHLDGNGNVVMLTDPSGTVVSEYIYDAFGKLLLAVGNIENNYLFSSQQYDADAGLYYHRSRYRDVRTSRFTQMDTYPGRVNDPATLHKYNYAHHDPVNLSDPSGKFSIGQVMSAVNVAANLATSATVGYRLGQFATGEREASAKEIGFTVLIAAAGPAGGKLAKMLGNSKIANNICKNVCNLLDKVRVIGPTVKLRNPGSIKFTQSSIKKSFSDGGSLDDLIAQLRSGATKPDALPPIRIFRKDGKIFTLDNRRLYAAQQAGVKIRTVGASKDEVLRESWKFTTKNGGSSIRVRGKN